MALCMIIIPMMIKLAPKLGMIDIPEERKVHVKPIPRVGGVGIVLGAMFPAALLLPFEEVYMAYIIGCLVLLVFGVLDDVKELGHYTKFIGQFIAAIILVYYGNLYVYHFPFMGLEYLPERIGKPFTVFALMGMMNATNHSDGLDGLAGGLSLVSFIAIAYLIYQTGDNQAIVIVLAAMGGIFGFLRFNTHPAIVFMGDGGSQFLGFTLGVVAVLLTQNINPALSAALPLLLLGLPVVDILAVFAQRIYHKMNWFKASKNHIHHRLLELGFYHQESVIIIYIIQIFLVSCGVLLVYESDYLITALYLLVCISLFMFLLLSERKGWRAHKTQNSEGVLARFIEIVTRNRAFSTVPYQILNLAIPFVFILSSISAQNISYDISITATLLSLLLIVSLLIKNKQLANGIYKVVVYVTAAFAIFFENKYLADFFGSPENLDVLYFGVIAFCVGLVIKYNSKNDFRTTPMDYLMVVAIIVSAIILNLEESMHEYAILVVKLLIVFYASEIILNKSRKLISEIGVSVIITHSILIYKGVSAIFG